MTSYSKATNFAAKDALLTGNPSKVVKGAEIDAEFTAIQAADATSLKNGEALGTPSGGTLTNCTGLPVSTGISGLGTGVATFLATPSSANLASAVTGETGSGALVFATSPTLVTPTLGTPASGTLTNCSGLPGTGATFLQAGTGATSRTVQDKQREIFSVKDFGAVGNGVADDTAAIEAAIAAGIAIGYCTIYFPPGSYLVSSTITISSSGVRLMGAGMWITKITRSTDYGDTIKFTGNDGTGTIISDAVVDGMSFISSGLTTSGAHLHFNGVSKATVASVYMEQGFIGIKANGLLAAYIRELYFVFTNIYAGSATGRRYMQFGNAAATYAHPSCGDIFVSNFNVRGNTSGQVTEFGINIISGDGIWFENGHVGNASSANIRLSAETAENLDLIFFDNVMADEGLAYGLLFEGAVSLGRTIKFSNCTFKSGGSPAWADYGILTSATANFYGVIFDGCTVTEYGLHGVLIQSSAFRQVVFNGCIVKGNGRDAANTYSGYLLANGVQDIVFNGGVSGGAYDSPSGTATQAYGLGLGTTSNITVTGMDLRGNSLGSVSDSSGSTLYSNCRTQDSTSIASTSTVTLPTNSEQVFTITGTTQINNISATTPRRVVTLVFADIVTVTDGGNKKLAGAFTSSADDTLTLFFDGTNWVEICRSVN